MISVQVNRVDPSELEGATIDHFAQAQDVADLEGPRLSRAELLEEIEMQRLDAMNARWFAEGEIQGSFGRCSFCDFIPE